MKIITVVITKVCIVIIITVIAILGQEWGLAIIMEQKLHLICSDNGLGEHEKWNALMPFCVKCYEVIVYLCSVLSGGNWTGKLDSGLTISEQWCTPHILTRTDCHNLHIFTPSSAHSAVKGVTCPICRAAIAGIEKIAATVIIHLIRWILYWFCTTLCVVWCT